MILIEPMEAYRLLTCSRRKSFGPACLLHAIKANQQPPGLRCPPSQLSDTREAHACGSVDTGGDRSMMDETGLEVIL